MSSITINGDTSGSIILQAPAVSGSTTLTLPTTSGTFLTTTGGVTPGTAGNILVSNGTAWTSAAPASGGVTSLNGQTGAITNTDFGAIGSYVLANGANNTNYNMNDTIAGSSLQKCSTSSPVSLGSRDMSGAGFGYINTMTSAGLSGTWRSVSVHGNSTGTAGYASTGLWVRIS